MMRLLVALLAVVLGVGVAHAEIKWEVVQTLPHDPHAFTQGLTIHGDHIYETTGHVGRSELRILKLKDAKLLRRQPMRADVFGEGSTIWNDRIISLTWQHETGFIWRLADLKPVGSFTYSGEGWGLTQDGKSLIMSDGTADLRFLDPETFQEQRRITVTWRGEPVPFLNELEYAEGAIYANVWYSPLIARIDPVTGEVDDWINVLPLVAENAGRNSEAVLNGIAWDAKNKLLYITGKNWPKLYALRITD